MAQLAIKGHPTRGKEVINLLEMMGGKNKYGCYGEVSCYYYFINENRNIDTYYGCVSESDFTVFTLEEFLEKYPYKVGDEVIIKNKNQIAIVEMITWSWSCDTINYWLKYDGYIEGVFRVEDLQKYKEKTMENKNEKSINHVYDTEIISFDIARKDKYELDLQGKFEIKLHEGKYYVERIKSQYPKTYEECASILNTYCNYCSSIGGYNWKLLSYFQQLLICRDAYWKIACREMGLGKSWKPDFTNNDEERYGMYTAANEVEKDFCGVGDVNTVLTFPTEEMRDAFYENFKELIERCKELL